MYIFNFLDNRKFVGDMFEKFCGSVYLKFLIVSLSEKLKKFLNVLLFEI